METATRDVRKNAAQREAVEGQLRLSKANLAAKIAILGEADKVAGDDEARAAALELAAEGARALAAQRQSEKDAIASEVASVRAQFGATLERLNAMRRAVGELETATRDGELQIRAKENQIARAAGEDAQIVGRESGLVASLEEHGTRRAALETNLQTARTERGLALERLGVTAVELKATREQLHIAEVP